MFTVITVKVSFSVEITVYTQSRSRNKRLAVFPAYFTQVSLDTGGYKKKFSRQVLL